MHIKMWEKKSLTHDLIMISKTKIHIINFFSRNNQFNIFIHHIQCSFVSLWKLSNFQTLKKLSNFQPSLPMLFQNPYSLNLRLWIFIRTSLPMVPAMGLLTSELWGLTPGDRGLMLMGDVWLMGERSLLAGVPVPM